MKFLQCLGLILAILVGTSAAVAVVGGVIYLTVPPAAEWMDETIFNKKDDTTENENDTTTDDENTEEEPSEGEEVVDPETGLVAKLNFKTKSIILGV